MKEMMMSILINERIQIDCQKVIQNNVEFYLGKLSFKKLAKIVTVTQRVILSFDDTGMPIYNNQLQRKPSPTRVNQIRDYLINDESATFPNSILVSVPTKVLAEEIQENNTFYLLTIDESQIELVSEDNPLYVQIIDGQHRFYGMQLAVESLRKSGDNPELLENLENFEFVISFFIEPEIDFQAMLFSTINRTPVKVSQDLVYDLFGLLDKDSPQKTALAICLELNGDKKSAFYKRIRLLGKKIKGEDSIISQGMFIKTILQLISPNLRVAEMERFKDREYFKSGGSPRTIFREFYANDRDNNMYRTVDNFFTAAKETFLDENRDSYWVIGDTPDNPFQKTIGFLALIDVMIELFYLGIANKTLNVEFFRAQLSKAANIKLFEEDGTSSYAYSSAGKAKLSRDLLDLISNG